MRVAGVQCDTCAKKALAEHASPFQMPHDIFPVPSDWFYAVQGNEYKIEPSHFCSGKCLSEWALKQDLVKQPQEE